MLVDVLRLHLDMCSDASKVSGAHCMTGAQPCGSTTAAKEIWGFSCRPLVLWSHAPSFPAHAVKVGFSIPLFEPIRIIVSQCGVRD
jgi:hypothetical protein